MPSLRNLDGSSLSAVWRLSLGALAFCIVARAVAAPTIVRDFNGPDTSWKLLDNGTPARVFAQKCVAGGARDTAGVERIVIAAPAGQSALLMCPVPKVAVLDELDARLWVSAPRPGVQLAAGIVLPRSINPQTHDVVTAIVRGMRYERIGKWQQLVLNEVPRLLADEVRVMRVDAGFSIDPREAYVDAVVLVVPGQPEGMEFSVNQLEINGILKEGIRAAAPSSNTIQNESGREGPRVSPVGRSRRLDPVADGSIGSAISPVRLVGDTLLVENQPFVPRAIQWQGESFQFLMERGFNTIQLMAPPTAAQSADAKKFGLWILAKPPLPDAIDRDGLGQADDRVLAWCLDDAAGEVDPDYFRQWADLIRLRDRVPGRPVVISSEADGAKFSNIADVIAMGSPWFARKSAAEFGAWLDERTRFTTPTIPCWICIGSQFGAAVSEQCAALRGSPAPSPGLENGRLEMLIEVACTRATRGYLFRSTTSLDETDPATRIRAMTLELINRRLQLMEPWLAAGKVVGHITSSDPRCSAVMLQVDRARLLLPFGPALQREDVAPGENAGRSSPAAFRTWTVPGIPESSQAFSLRLTGLHPLSTTRVAGGTRVGNEPGDKGFLMLTEDPQAIRGLSDRVQRTAPQVIRLERDLAAGQGARLAEDSRRLKDLGFNADPILRDVATADSLVRRCDALLATNRNNEAGRLAENAYDALQQASETERGLVAGPTLLCSYPLAAGDNPRADHARVLQRLGTLQAGDNLLYGGDFEDLGQITQFGWQHISHPTTGIHEAAELSTIEPKHGNYCVRLLAAADKSASGPAISPAAAVWIISPAVHLERGQIIEIAGWVRVADSNSASAGGLEILDSLAGPELSISVRKTAGWQPFQMIRAATRAADLRLTFALTGLGTADIDALMVRILQQPIARRLPPIATSGPGASERDDGIEGPLLTTPQP